MIRLSWRCSQAKPSTGLSGTVMSPCRLHDDSSARSSLQRRPLGAIVCTFQLLLHVSGLPLVAVSKIASLWASYSRNSPVAETPACNLRALGCAPCSAGLVTGPDLAVVVPQPLIGCHPFEDHLVEGPTTSPLTPREAHESFQSRNSNSEVLKERRTSAAGWRAGRNLIARLLQRMGSRGMQQAQADPRRDTQQSSSQSSTAARHARRRRSGGASCSQRGSPWQRVCSGALLLAALTLLHGPGPRPAAAEAVDENTFISDTERFPGWRGTLPGVKYAAEQAGGDPNRARTMAHGSLGEVRLTHAATSRCGYLQLQTDRVVLHCSAPSMQAGAPVAAFPIGTNSAVCNMLLCALAAG